MRRAELHRRVDEILKQNVTKHTKINVRLRPAATVKDEWKGAPFWEPKLRPVQHPVHSDASAISTQQVGFSCAH